MNTEGTELILNSNNGFEFKVNNKIWQIPPTKLKENTKICFISSDIESNSDSSIKLCKIISSIEDQLSGDYYLFGKDISKLNYSERLNLRKKIGYIQSSGGLFSNKTVEENLTFPITIHPDLTNNTTEERIEFFIEKFNLTEFKDLRPHEIDGLTRWRTCAARALIMRPKIIIIEGVGDWHHKKDISFFWKYMLEMDFTLIVSLTVNDSIFQEWFTNKLQGKLINIELAKVII